MEFEDLLSIPVESIVAADAHLHLWATSSFIAEGLDLIKAWGFEYKSSAVWVKPGRPGLGNYWRISHEFLLTGVRGDLRRFADRNLLSWHERPRLEHSRKPHLFRELIERASPEPRIELFGRQDSPGWTVWGNQIERHLWSESG